MTQWQVSDSITTGKRIYIFVIIVFMLTLIWFTINYPAKADIAQIYWWLMMSSLIIWAIDLGLKKNGTELIDTGWFESESLIFGKIEGNKMLAFFALSVVVGLAVFSQIIFTGQSFVGTPVMSHQILDLGITGEVMLTTIAAVAEDLLFFGFIPFAIFGILFMLTKNPYIAFVFAIVFNPFIFMFYHFYVYGLENMSASVSVWVFALINTVIVMIMRNLMMTHFFHVFNNLGTVFRKGAQIGMIIFGGG